MPANYPWDRDKELGFRLLLADYVRAQALPVDKFGHQPRLYWVTTLVGRGHLYDDDVVYAAAWLHDLGVFVGHRPEEERALEAWDSVGYAMCHAPEVLLRAGFPAEKCDAVVEAIRTHQPGASPKTLEGIILRDADILEQLGSVGILRAAAKIGRDTRYRTFTEVASTLTENLLELPRKILLDTAKVLAQPRITVLREFLESLELEAGGGLY